MIERQINVASISGGKDSVAMCLELVRRRWAVDYFVFCDTGAEYPEAYDALDRFEKLTGRTITRLKAKEDFSQMAAFHVLKHHGGHFKANGEPKRAVGYGWPSMLRRWCTRYFKIDQLNRFYRSFGPGAVVHEIIGIAADEPKRVRDKIYPLVEWGWTEADCLAYCRERGFYPPGSAYDFCDRVSCFCCPMSNDRQIRYLIKQRPELWQRIKDIEAAIGEPWMCWRGRLPNGKFRDCAYYERKFTHETTQMQLELDDTKGATRT